MGSALSACSVMRSKPDAAPAAAFTAAVIGDVPYGTSPTDTRQMVLHPRFVAAMNADADVSLVAHIGDIRACK